MMPPWPDRRRLVFGKSGQWLRQVLWLPLSGAAHRRCGRSTGESGTWAVSC